MGNYSLDANLRRIPEMATRDGSEISIKSRPKFKNKLLILQSSDNSVLSEVTLIRYDR